MTTRQRAWLLESCPEDGRPRFASPRSARAGRPPSPRTTSHVTALAAVEQIGEVMSEKCTNCDKQISDWDEKDTSQNRWLDSEWCRECVLACIWAGGLDHACKVCMDTSVSYSI